MVPGAIVASVSTRVSSAPGQRGGAAQPRAAAARARRWTLRRHSSGSSPVAAKSSCRPSTCTASCPRAERTAQPSLGDLKSNSKDGFSQLIGGGRGGTICNEVFKRPNPRKPPDQQPEGYLGFFLAKVLCAEAGNPAEFVAFKQPPPPNIGALFQAASTHNDLTLAPVATDGAVFKAKYLTRRTTPFFAGVLEVGGAPSDISSPTDDSAPDSRSPMRASEFADIFDSPNSSR